MSTPFTKVMTAPLAIVKVGGVPIGKMKNIRLTETIRRSKVMGLGRLTPDELAATEWDGTLNCSEYLVDFSQNVLPGALYRNVASVDQFVDTVLLDEDGVQIDIMRKVINTKVNGIVDSKLVVFCSIVGCFITREGMDISESQIGGRDADFEYTTPVIFS